MLIKKALNLILSFLMIVTVTFFLMHSIPGDPFMDEQALPEEIMKALRKQSGLDQPLIAQYFTYLKGIFLHFDLGYSFKYQGRTVNQIIAEGFPISLLLGVESLLFSIFGGLSLGAIASLYHQRWQDSCIIIFVTLGVSIPGFLLATFFQYLLAIKLDLFPIALWGTFSHTCLPVLALSAFPLAYITKLSRASTIEILRQDYLLTAYSKGLNPFQILMKHTVRNTLIPIIAYLGPLIASIFTGSFVIEKIFGIPGLGQWLVSGISNRDYTVIMGITIFYSALLLLAIFLVDCLFCLIDPRIRNSQGNHGRI